MKESFSVIFCAALLWWGAASSLSPPAFAGSCCGGSSGGGLIIPKFGRELADLAFSLEQYDGFWNKDGGYTPDPSGLRLLQYRISAGFARRFGSSWQASITVPYILNNNKYPGLSSSTHGPGDATPGLWYEALDDASAWRIRKWRDLVPSVLIGVSLLAPTGVSPYDNVKSSFDVTGRGFYRLDGNVLVSKTLHPWSASMGLSYGTNAQRPVNREYGKYVAPYYKKLGDRFSASASLGYIYYVGSGGDALTGAATFSHAQESDAVTSGRRDSGAGLRKEALGGSITYSSTDHDWTLRASWTHAMKISGWGENFPATDVFVLGGGYAFR